MKMNRKFTPEQQKVNDDAFKLMSMFAPVPQQTNLADFMRNRGIDPGFHN
jgi:hypothetical protein